MPIAAWQIAVRDAIAVGEQHSRFAFVGLDAGGVDGHHVGPVEEIGDAAEAFSLALRAIDIAGAVKPHQLGVASRIDQSLDLKLEWAVRHLRDGKSIRRRDEIFRGQRLAVQRE